jgi:AcrR family transcriptional regulator
MTDAGPRGPYAKTAARRQAIVRAARDSFVERGVDGASLRDIAARAGITHAGLLHHFASKDELVVEVLRRRHEEEAERARAQGPDVPVQAFLVGLLGEHRSAPELIRLWAELTASASRPGHPAQDYFAERYASTRAYFAEALQQAAEEGSALAEVGPEAAGALLAAVMDGLQAQWLLAPELPVDDLLRCFLALLLSARPAG